MRMPTGKGAREGEGREVLEEGKEGNERKKQQRGRRKEPNTQPTADDPAVFQSLLCLYSSREKGKERLLMAKIVVLMVLVMVIQSVVWCRIVWATPRISQACHFHSIAFPICTMQV